MVEKKFVKGDVFSGISYVDMVNKILGTQYRAWMKSFVELKKIGKSKTIAWFVYMNGLKHGTKKYCWENHIIGDEIHEIFVGTDINAYKREVSKCLIGRANRLAFQRDPNGTGNKYECKFLGYYELEHYDNETFTNVYKKKSDEFQL